MYKFYLPSERISVLIILNTIKFYQYFVPNTNILLPVAKVLIGIISHKNGISSGLCSTSLFIKFTNHDIRRICL